MEWRQRERVPLPKGAELTIEGITVVNDDDPEQMSKGSTCLVYHGHIKNDSGGGVIPGSVIIKEFYPDTMNRDVLLDIHREAGTNKLLISKSTKEKDEYKLRYVQFMQGLASQKELASSEAMEIGIKPLYYGTYGDSCYIISDAHRGADLKKVVPETLKDKLNVAVCVAETMDILHETGYMMPDFKPENLLWINKPNLVKIIDTDSLIQYENTDDVKRKKLFGDRSYISPNLRKLEESLREETSKSRAERKKRFYLNPQSDMYVIGKYLYQLFWNRSFEGDNFKELNAEMLIGEFLQIYGEETKERSRLLQAAKGLIEIIGRMVISDSLKRKIYGYKNSKELMEALSDIYFGYTSRKYVPRKEIARANATFVAYNMLQKHPLFSYANVEDGVRQLRVALIGDHAMREKMLSAVISIGQMTDASLTVSVVAEDAEAFWSEYVSEKKNGALKKAITWSVDGEHVNDQTDEHLVSRSLAHINVITDTSKEMLQTLKREGYRYYVLLAEEDDINDKWAKILTERKSDVPVFIGYLQDEEETCLKETGSGDCFYPISAKCYSEYYNEKMFEEEIFDMGLRVHAYYYKCLDKLDSIDMDELKEGFCANLYNVESSERCALHAMYKMACVGLYGNIPRKARRFENKLQDPEVLEELSWIEHLSWTASLLTTGAQPESMDNFDTYAYQGNNDWKNKFNPDHMKHVLLVASQKTVPEADWTAEESYPKLDDLDQVSHRIFKWYISHKEDFRETLYALLEEWIPGNQMEEEFHKEMSVIVDKCIDGVGTGTMDQDESNIKEWKMLAAKVKNYAGRESCLAETIKKIEYAMRPVVDAYKDRDFKELDRRLVYVAAEIAG